MAPSGQRSELRDLARRDLVEPRGRRQECRLLRQGRLSTGGRCPRDHARFDSHTGAIVDADIVINGLYDFAVLPSGARAAAGAIAITNEPAAGTDVSPANPFGLAVGATNAGTAVFDLLHVLAHESGHVLGLRDSEDDASDVMYPYTFPGDASRRAPSSDDRAGIESLYEAAPAVAGGCTISSVALPSASQRSRTSVLSWPAVIGIAACWVILLVRRRRASSAPFRVET